MDYWWWRKMAKLTVATPGMKVLDIAAGTGDSSIALAKKGAIVVSSDFAFSMLRLGYDKIRYKSMKNKVLGHVGADAHILPFKSSTFDALTICYGLRNLEQRYIAYAEFKRVLKPGARLVILEFSHPTRTLIRWLYDFYSRFFLVRIGGFFSGDKVAYRYLYQSIKQFPHQADLAQELINTGFADVSWKNLSFGIVAIHTAIVPANDNTRLLK